MSTNAHRLFMERFECGRVYNALVARLEGILDQVRRE